MALVLTEQSTVDCAHFGKVKLSATQSRLKVAGAKVLVTGDLGGASISNCQTKDNVPPPPALPSTHCTSVLTAIGGVATKLKVGGKGVLLQPVHGQTDGILSGLPQPWSVIAVGQTKLKAS